MAEFAPAGRRQFYNAIVYSGVPAGGVLASILGILFLDSIGWRGLFIIGSLPLVILLPIAWRKLPESPRWLLSRGREQEALAAAQRTGVPLIEERVILQVGAAPQKSGFAAVFSRQFAVASILLGLMSFSGLLLTYGLNTWLPKIMEGYGYGRTYSLFFPLALNLGAVAGGLLASRLADKSGPQRVIAATFVLATISLALMTFSFPLPLLFAFIALAGVGTLGTQVLVYGFQSNYFTTNARAAGRRVVRKRGAAGRGARSDHRRLAGRRRGRRVHGLLHLRGSGTYRRRGDRPGPPPAQAGGGRA